MSQRINAVIFGALDSPSTPTILHIKKPANCMISIFYCTASFFRKSANTWWPKQSSLYRISTIPITSQKVSTFCIRFAFVENETKVMFLDILNLVLTIYNV